MMDQSTTADAAVDAAELEGGVSPRTAEINSGITTAALQFVRAGMHDGRMLVSEATAVATAAAIYQLVYDAASMRAIMQRAAVRMKTRDAYRAVLDSQNSASEA